MKDLIIQITGWLNMLLFSIVTWPQIYKTLKTKTTSGVSISVYYILVLANIDALIYALLINQPPLLFKYVFGLVTSLIYIWVYFKYGRKNVNSSKTKTSL